MITHRNMGFPPLILLITLVVFVMMIFVLIIIVAGAALFAQAKSTTTTTTTTPHVTIAFVGDTSPIAGKDHVSVAGITTYNATSSSRNTEQKIITVSWGDGTSSQSKITGIPSSSEGKWGPLYHKYDSATASNPYTIVATLDVLSSSSSNNKGIVQIKSEPYLINVHKGPITGYSSDSLRSNIGLVPKNNELLFNPISQLGNIIALSVIVSVAACSLCMVRHVRRHSEKMIPTIDAYRDEKQNHYTNTRTFGKSK
jgi:hypothetical protein